MKTQLLRGKLEALGLIEVLSYVARARESGILSVQRNETEKSIVIHAGNIVFAKSNQVEDRMGDMLLNQGVITQEQYDNATQLLREKGYRHGRSLVEIGAITPKQLWRAVQEQIKQIAYSVIPLPDGNFEFVKQEIKQKEQITLELPVMNLLVDVIRHYDDRSIFRAKFPDMNIVVGRVPNDLVSVELEPYEQYVADRLDGNISIGELCETSDLGTEETLRVLFLLKVIGATEPLSFKDTDSEHFLSPTITKYNRMYREVNQYLVTQMGPVGGSLMRKYLEEVQQTHESTLSNVKMSKDGSLGASQILANADALEVAQEHAIMALEESLSEFLYACILGVKKALGTEHETAVVERLEAGV
ncbi:MAG: DUF4388 domain-containing protein [Acidobacteria bacterium]|nr:DUF4388 domain-containing protein [Acidobacteriota bacterium]